ncbi:MAG: cyanophycin synthetase, partial [Gemmatimonadales bacterium]
LRGRHQAANAALVWAAAGELGLDSAAVADALSHITIPGGRGEVAQYGALTILNDSYNANPASFRALIDLVAAMRAGRRLVFVAGTMRELGPDAARFHDEIAERLVALAPDVLAGIGEFVPALEAHRGSLPDRLVTAADAPALGPLLASRLRGDELVVLKGSRGVALERLIPDLVGRTAD